MSETATASPSAITRAISTGAHAALQRSSRSLWARLLRTNESVAATALRTTLGLVMLPHGAQKAFGWFGGGGFSATLRFFGDVLHVPAPLAGLVVGAELFGSLALIAGIMTRAAAMGIGLVMIGAVALVHAPNGFFMNWFGTQSGEGFEYHLLALGMVAALIVTGGGRASIDGLLSSRSASPAS
jgi:putative oxidoreductase